MRHIEHRHSKLKELIESELFFYAFLFKNRYKLVDEMAIFPFQWGISID